MPSTMNSAVLRRSFGTERSLYVTADGSLPSTAAAFALRPRQFPSTPQEIAAERQAVLDMMAQVNGQAPKRNVSVREMSLGGVPALIVAPPAVRGALLHLHGGGWYLGDPSIALASLTRWSDELGLIVASLDYRLAPEHRCPAAQDDCERGALAWLKLVRRQYPGMRVGITGESAGGHLAVVTAMRLRQRHAQDFDCALLTYGLYDFANKLPSREIADAYPGAMMDSRNCDFCAKTYLQDASQAFDPDVSPLRAPLAALRGMPPALFVSGGLDPLLDDSVVMHNHWARAGNAAWLAVYEDAFHGFDVLPGSHAQHVQQLQLEFLADTLQAQPNIV